MTALASVLLAVSASAAPPARAATPATPAQQALLERADVGAAAPASFRARMWLKVPDRPDGGRIEVWRSGETRTLVRFLDPGEEGKYLLYQGETVYFLSPGAKKPAKLPPQFRLRGSATLEDLLGRRYSRDFTVAAVEETVEGEGPAVAFHLEPRRPRSPYSRVLYVVRPDTGRPVRAEFRVRSGKLAVVLGFLEWTPGARLRPRRLAVRDELRGGARTEVEMVEFEERAVPDALFDRDDASARRRLERGE